MIPGLAGMMGGGGGGMSSSSSASSSTGPQTSSIGFQGGAVNFGLGATPVSQSWMLYAVVGFVLYTMISKKKG